MQTQQRDRLTAVEGEIRALRSRVMALEGQLRPAARTAVGQSVTPSSATTVPAAGRPAPAPGSPERPDPPPLRRQAAVPVTSVPVRPPVTERVFSLEELLGGRVLAWAGGAAVLIGLAFLFAMAVSRGWIGPGARVGLGTLTSVGLLAVGATLRERRGPVVAALAAAGAGVAGLDMTLIAATQLYHLLPAPTALVGAAAVGAAASALAVRFGSGTLAALGILGALLAPPVLGVTGDVVVVFLALVQLSAVGVLVWQRWDWLALGSLAVSAPQVAAWMFDAPPAVALVALTAVFWTLYVGAGIVFDLRDRAPGLRGTSAILVALTGVAAAAGGFFALQDIGHDSAARLWVAALAGAHFAVGLRAGRDSQAARDLSLLSVALGVVLADVALRLLTPGIVASLGWASTAVVFAGLLRRRPARGQELLGTALGGHLALALGQALLVDGSGHLPGTIPALLAVTVAAFGCARIVTGDAVWRRVLDITGMLTLAYLTASVLAGPALVLAWATEAVALAGVAQRTRDDIAHRGALGFLTLALGHVLLVDAVPHMLIQSPADLWTPLLAGGIVAIAAFAAARAIAGYDTTTAYVLDGVGVASVAYFTAIALHGPMLAIAWSAQAATVAQLARVGRHDAHTACAALLCLALGHVLVLEAPPQALIYGVSDLWGATLALLAAAAAALSWRPLARHVEPRASAALGALCAAALLYLSSVAIVTGFAPGSAQALDSGTILDGRQQGQVALSALWALCGLATLTWGLMRTIRPARLGGLGLLTLAMTKVFLFDLSTLDAFNRVLSFMGLGLLLLLAAYAYGRMAPRDEPAGPDADEPEAGAAQRPKRPDRSSRTRPLTSD
jgi:uncharacterized membrane protein